MITDGGLRTSDERTRAAVRGADVGAAFLAMILSSWANAASPSNDPYFPQQWALHNDGTQTVTIDADDLHTILRSGVAGVDIGWVDAAADVAAQAKDPVTVAVIDSGIDPSHPDLQGRYTSDGWDFLLSVPLLSDPMGHGTHVSGIIAASAGNGIGIAGVAPASVKVLPLRILSDDFQNFSYAGKLISDYAAAAVSYAVAHGASVINLSLGWPQIVDTPTARTAFAAAIKSGVLIVAAAGNDNKDEPVYPCAYEGVVCVGALSNNGTRAIYSSYGGDVDVMAPGDGIISTYPINLESETLRITGYEQLTGTSQAAPFVSAIAATIKSANPSITLNELKARLFAGARVAPTADAALYGLVNLKAALEAKPAPAYQPDFKSLQQVPFDEVTLKASGSLSVTSLWVKATQVQAQVLVNGQPAGAASIASLAEGASLTIPWSYHFASFDESSRIQLSIKVSDSTGTSHMFSANIPVVRSVAALTPSVSVVAPGVQASDWIGSTNGHPFAKVAQVSSYPVEDGLPRYYRQLGVGPLGSQVQLFDPTNTANPVQVLNIPGIQNVQQIVHMDANGDGRRDWLFIGAGTTGTGLSSVTFFEFYFADSNFKPLFPAADGGTSASEWRISNAGGQNVQRNYAAGGTWVKVGGLLLPCFLAQGLLPTKDNYDPLDERAYMSATHLYYFSPVPPTAPTPAGSAFTAVQLELRAFDNAAFRNAQASTTFTIETALPEAVADQAAGALRFLVATGTGVTAPNSVWSLGFAPTPSVSAATGWNTMSAAGQAFQALSDTPGSSLGVLLAFFSSGSGSLAWASPSGQFFDETPFSFSSPEDPLLSVFGAFSSETGERTWFAETQFEIVGYRQESASTAVQTSSISIERESSFAQGQFEQMFQAVRVPGVASGTWSPGVYIDTTLARGNRLAVDVWNPGRASLDQPVRFSLDVPPGCVEMSPVQIDALREPFALPYLCQTASGGAELRVIVP